MLRFIVPLILVLLPLFSIGSYGVSGIVPSIIFDIILISLSTRVVTPNTVKTVEFLGKYNRVLRPGLNFIIPFFEWTKSQTLFRRNFPIDVEGITGDKVTGLIGLNVIYYVEDDKNDTEEGNIYKSIYNIDDPKTMMRSTIDEQLRAMMVTFTHKNIFEKREEIGEAIEERLRVKLASFGYRLDSIQVRDVKLESSVMAAMNKVIETQQLREAALNEAEAKKIMQVKEAEAEKESKILLGEGMAGQRMKIAEGFKESVELIKQTDDSLNAEKVLQFLLDSSRIETLGNIGSKENAKLIYLNEDLEGRASKLVSGSEIM
ncbi:MAG: SPFH domain-containing protein [Candidatus Gracilibacteria bacterium]|nr:SPFH domain-containing protein [Candidatus Gracilibacteria bacterium]